MQVTKFNLVTDLQIMLSNVTHSNFYFECNTERGSIDQLYTGCGSPKENPTDFKIVKEPLLVQKQTIPQQKALDLSFNLTP
mgnify:CR=1 FL=1